MKCWIGYGPRGEKQFFLGDRQVTREEFDAVVPNRIADLLKQNKKSRAVPGGHAPGNWPKVSEALAVHPDQVAEATARNKRHGVNVPYDPETGCAILPDRAERARLLRLENMHDNQGGYGD